jgi:ADP-heptose:LPS heptosyltransferase
MTSARILLRTAGLGDVVMALAAAKALKALTGDQILLATSKRYVDLAKACPHVDYIITLEHMTPEEHTAVRLAKRLGRLYELNSVSYGLAREHQVDAYLWAAGLEAPPELKDVDLKLPQPLVDRVEVKCREAGVREGSIVLHPAKGDPNRTWPAARWTELAGRLADLGHSLVLIGARDGQKGAFDLPDTPAVNLIGQLDPLETVALLRRSTALITTDSGALHLAAASDAAIVGIFSVVRGANRLPFRYGLAAWKAVAVEPLCPSFPCYRSLNRPEVLIPLVEDTNGNGAAFNEIFVNWCLQPQSAYACMRESIDTDAVLEALTHLVKAPVLDEMSAV